MQNFQNMNFRPDISEYVKYQDPTQNEVFNKATHPSEKPIITKHIFAVDSRQRDYSKFPKANNYYIPIPERYRNVTAIELKAAMLPRTEYNVNSVNRYLDFVIGDFITDVNINGDLTNFETTDAGTYTFTTQGVGTNGQIQFDLGTNGRISNIIVNNSGSGYSYSEPPRFVCTTTSKQYLFDSLNIDAVIGFEYVGKLREGQYSIGGNPEFYLSSGTIQSWVPNNLVCELENAMSYAILEDSNYCYSRKSVVQGGTNTTGGTDYPLLFTTRLMSQYPNVTTYETNAQPNPENYNTNACTFNRMYFTNCLIFKYTIVGPPVVGSTVTDGNSINYKILKVQQIPASTSGNDYIIYCELDDPSASWVGLTPITSVLELAHWEFLFATGRNKVINSATLLGYNKRNYGYNDIVANQVIQVNSPSNTLIPSGFTYSTENDYYLYGDPEYVVLSFRPKYGGNSIIGINDRVDSNPNSNLDRVFACLIYDTVQPAVLQDLSSGKLDTYAGSQADDNNKNKGTFLEYDSNITDTKQLVGNSGYINTSYYRPPGQLKAMKGSEFDRKIVEFPQPVAQIFNMNIRFTKFSKGAIGSDEELYNFHGKEHLLLFEITCSDLLTGRRS